MTINIYHEHYELGQSMKHSLNCYFGAPVFTKDYLDQMGIKANITNGKQNYDINGNYSEYVLGSVIGSMGYMIAKINNIDLTEKAILKLIDRYITVKKIEGQWYNCDSLLTRPLKIFDIQQFINSVSVINVSILIIYRPISQGTLNQSEIWKIALQKVLNQ